jgi:hypothetical protein
MFNERFLSQRLSTDLLVFYTEEFSVQSITLSLLLKVFLPSNFSVFILSWHTYLLTPWSRVLLEKLTGLAASQEIPRIYGTRMFITVPTSARHLSLSWARSIQSPQPPHTSCRSLLILSSHLRLGLAVGLLPSGFPTNTLCTPLPSTIRATCPAHLILLDFTTRTILGKEYRSPSSSLCNFLNYPDTSSLLRPNTLLSTLFLYFSHGPQISNRNSG